MLILKKHIFSILLGVCLSAQFSCIKSPVVRKNMSYDFFIIGFRYENRQKFEMALHAYKEAVRYDANSSYLYYRIAKVQNKLKQFDPAIKSMKMALKIEKNVDYYNFLGKLNISMARIEKPGNRRKIKSYYKTALKYFKGCLQFDPRNQEAIRSLGIIYELLQRPAEAANYYKKILEGDSYRNIEVVESLYRIYFREGRFDEAVNLLKKLLERDMDNLYAITAIGNVYLAKKEFKKAIEWYHEAMPVQMEAKIVVLEKLAKIYLTVDDLVKAEEQYKYLVQIADRAEYWKMLGILQYRQKKYDDSQNSFYQVLSTNDDYDAHFYMGSIFLDKSEFDKAILEFGKCLSQNKMHYGATVNSAIALMGKKEFDTAVNYLLDVQSRFPKYARIPYLAGVCFKYLDKTEDAIKAFKHAISLDSNDLVSYFECGALYEKINEYQKAVEIFRRIILKKPDYVSALNYLAYMWAERGE
ncbi:MAG: tetratricopeptide repeat protein, partial [bacterium]